MTYVLGTNAQRTNTKPLDPAVPPARNSYEYERLQTKMHDWAQRVKRLLRTKSQVNAGVSRLVVDAELEPFRAYYRQHSALRGGNDEQMLQWYGEQAA